MPGIPTEAKLDGSAPCQRHHGHARQSHEDAHGSIGNVIWVCGARGVVEGAVEAGEDAGQTDEHLAQRRVHIEIKGLIDVVLGLA
jgi:hypothetical protein